MPILCSMPMQRTALRSPSEPSSSTRNLGTMKQEMPLVPGRGVGHPGQHEVDDVVGEVLLAVGDEDLLARDAPGAVVGRHGLGGEGADVGAGLRLGEVHGAGPLARDHAAQVDLVLLLAAVVLEHVDGALGEQRAHRERHVGGGEELLHGDGQQPREPAAAVGLGEGHGAPAGLVVLGVGVLPPRRRGDLARSPGRASQPTAGRRPG